MNLKIPQSVFIALKIPDEEKESILSLELALALYQRGILSFGKARELAHMSKVEFHNLLGKRKISRHYTLENFQEDLTYGKSA